MAKYSFRGTALVTINVVRVEADSEEEALKQAKEIVDATLTAYGYCDTQIDNVSESVILEIDK